MIVDPSMAKASGIQLAAVSARLHPELPVLIGSVDARAVEVEAACAVGVRGFLAKPHTVSQVADALRLPRSTARR